MPVVLPKLLQATPQMLTKRFGPNTGSAASFHGSWLTWLEYPCTLYEKYDYLLYVCFINQKNMSICALGLFCMRQIVLEISCFLLFLFFFLCLFLFLFFFFFFFFFFSLLLLLWLLVVGCWLLVVGCCLLVVGVLVVVVVAAVVVDDVVVFTVAFAVVFAVFVVIVSLCFPVFCYCSCINQRVGLSTNPSIHPSINHSIIQTFEHSIIHSFIHSFIQSFIHSIHQSNLALMKPTPQSRPSNRSSSMSTPISFRLASG